MFKKIIFTVFTCFCCLLASFCVGVYIRASAFDGFSLRPAVGAIVLIAACVFVYVAARSAGNILFPQHRKRLIRCALSFSYILYVILLINFLFFESAFDRQPSIIFLQNKEVVAQYLDEFLNLDPFSMIHRYAHGFRIGTVSFQRFFMNVIGNFVLFMPFAFFLPLEYKKQNNFFVFFFTVSSMSFVAEVLQVITMTGTGDVDDLLLNTFGACLLYGLLQTKVGKMVVKFIGN